MNDFKAQTTATAAASASATQKIVITNPITR